MNTSINFASLEAPLTRLANQFARDQHEAQDIYQAMAEALLTKSSPEDSKSRLLTRARWAALHYVEAQAVYSFYVGSEDDLTGKADSDDDEADAFELYAPVQQNPEDMVIEREAQASIVAAVKALPAKFQQIVSLISIGYSQREIAAEIGTSEQNVSYMVKRMKDELKKKH